MGGLSALTFAVELLAFAGGICLIIFSMMNKNNDQSKMMENKMNKSQMKSGKLH